jgi:hypothetical protein
VLIQKSAWRAHLQHWYDPDASVSLHLRLFVIMPVAYACLRIAMLRHCLSEHYHAEQSCTVCS